MKLKPMSVEIETSPMEFPIVRVEFVMVPDDDETDCKIVRNVPGLGPIGIPTIPMLEGDPR